jgi:site-specific DNA-methyltransferase (adenine-specific)
MSDLYLGDCLDVMKTFPDNEIDLILVDLPYQLVACSWDSMIPLEPLWEQYNRITKENAAMVFTASQPFTTILISSKIKKFLYECIW